MRTQANECAGWKRLENFIFGDPINTSGGTIAPKELPDEIAKVVLESTRAAGYAH